MVGILIVAHGNLGEGFIDATTHILGARQERLEHLSVTGNDDPVVLRERVGALLKRLDAGSGVLILSDICGATPCNVVTQASQAGKIEVISGLNLPMLLRALTYRGEPLPSVVAKALSGGAQGVLRMTAS